MAERSSLHISISTKCVDATSASFVVGFTFVADDNYTAARRVAHVRHLQQKVPPDHLINNSHYGEHTSDADLQAGCCKAAESLRRLRQQAHEAIRVKEVHDGASGGSIIATNIAGA